ncbi:MAG: UDP-N-acetylmuramate:L-alanyl-gamma-D-glutamyl-meso-diaminopimelate ligase [Deltaproteobacteria bacterium]|nr:UDP-N-acetylmuramate:L-alanyl-gamma-D-glutamyl-meso-diaminopimelate ligase [Deltaproteobacteria bacterium]
MGVCGTGMASLAGMLTESGYTVTGSDQNVYPPMSDFLASLGIEIMMGYRPENLNHNPDLVVVGNVIRRDNPEAVALVTRGIPYLSFPQTLAHFFLKDRLPLVVTGTHGKTTTSCLLAWLLTSAGWDPGFMLGGIAKNFAANCHVGTGRYFVVEGDEYDTAFFDKGPKFLHYRPHMAILTGIEFDHADIYRDLDHVVGSFDALVKIIDPQGALFVWNGCELARKTARNSTARVVTYGLDGSADIRAKETVFRPGGAEFTMGLNGRAIPLSTPLPGRHNILNALAAAAVAMRVGLSADQVRQGLAAFAGVHRRQDVRGEKDGRVVIDDFAHHPTAVKETLLAIKTDRPGQRLVAIFEPRTNTSRRNVFQDDYAEAFDQANLILVRVPPDLEKVPAAERFSSARLVDDLRRRNLSAYCFQDTEQIIDFLKVNSKPNDVLLVMSNGGFDNIHQRLLSLSYDNV